MTKIYAIHELPSYAEKQKGYTSSLACVTDGYDRDEVIKSATEYYEQKLIDDGEEGEHEQEVVLITYDEDTNTESEETITLQLDAGENFDPQAEWGTWNKAQLGL